MMWEERRFGEFFKIRHGFAFKSEFYSREGKFILLTPGNFFEVGGFRHKGEKETYYVGEIPASYILKQDDLLVAMTEQAAGLLGSAALIPADNRYLHNQRLGLVVELDEKRLNRKFLFHLFNSRNVRLQIHSGAGGTKVRHTSPDKILATRFLYPPFYVQLKIAEVLSSFDRRILFLSELIAAKTQYKRGLMQQLLTGRKRFPEFVSSTEKRTSEAGRFPKDWTLHRLGEVTAEVRRRNDSGVTRVLTASGNRGLIDQQDYFNRSVAGKSLENYYLLKRGEFAYNRSLMKGYPYGATKRLDAYDEGVVSVLYLCFRISSDDCNSNWLAHVFEGDIFNSQLRGIAKVGARAHGLLNVATSEFFDMILPMPSRQEQDKIATVLDAAEKEIDLLQKQLAALKTQKQGLMQKLLTGQVRVRVNDEAQAME
jgi:type I restriction enzyme S subunit